MEQNGRGTHVMADARRRAYDAVKNVYMAASIAVIATETVAGVATFGGALVIIGCFLAGASKGLSNSFEVVAAVSHVLANGLSHVTFAGAVIAVGGFIMVAIAVIWAIVIWIHKSRRPPPLKTIPPEMDEAAEYFDSSVEFNTRLLFIQEDGLVKKATYRYIRDIYLKRTAEPKERAILRLALHEAIAKNQVHFAKLCIETLGSIHSHDGFFSVSILGLISSIEECKEFLCAAIRRDCDVSIIRGLDQLWLRLAVKEEQLLSADEDSHAVSVDEGSRCQALVTNAQLAQEQSIEEQRVLLTHDHLGNDCTKTFNFYREVLAESCGTELEVWSESAVFYQCLIMGVVDREFINKNMPSFDQQLFEDQDTCFNEQQRRKYMLSSKTEHAKQSNWSTQNAQGSQMDSGRIPKKVLEKIKADTGKERASSARVRAEIAKWFHDVDVFRYIKGHLEVDVDTETVTSDVEAYIKQLVQIEKLKKLFGENCQIKPVRVGSSVEGTRCFQPDEFDYMLILSPTIKLITEERHNFRKKHKDFMFRVTDEGCVDLEDKVLLDEYKKSGHFYMLSDRAKSAVYDAIEEELTRRVRERLTEKRWPRTPGQDAVALEETPTGFFSRNHKFSVIRLIWNGHMKISIDLVPALDIDYNVGLFQHQSLHRSCKLPIVTYGQSVIYTPGYSEYENEIIKSLPNKIKQGYIWAKAVRRASVLRGTQGAADVDDFEELIKTYQLKTTLFFMTADGWDDLRDMEPTEIAVKIYLKLRYFVTENCRLPHFFENPLNRAAGECLECCDWLDVESGQKEREAQRKQEEAEALLREAEILESQAKSLKAGEKFEEIMRQAKANRRDATTLEEQSKAALKDVDETKSMMDLKLNVIERIISFLCDHSADEGDSVPVDFFRN